MWPLLVKLEPYLSWVILILVVGWLVYAGALKPVLHPNPSTTQNGGVSYTTNVGFGGCASLGATRQRQEKQNAIVNKVNG